MPVLRPPLLPHHRHPGMDGLSVPIKRLLYNARVLPIGALNSISGHNPKHNEGDVVHLGRGPFELPEVPHDRIDHGL